MNFAYPLGKSAQEANVARSKLSLEQIEGQPEGARAADRDRRDQRGADRAEQPRERAGARPPPASWRRSKLDATQSKFEVGMSTNYEVVQAQRDFADAQNTELRAVLNYRKALVNFETVQTVGTRGVGAAVTAARRRHDTGGDRRRRSAATAPAAADSNSRRPGTAS